MIRYGLPFVFVLGCATGPLPQKPLSADQIRGKWTVVDVACEVCQGRTPEEKGVVLEFDSTRIHNPLFDNCDARPGYDLLAPVVPATLLRETGSAWPASVKADVAAAPSSLYGFVTCEGVNYAQMAFTSPVRGYYFAEGGVVFVLGRR